MKNVSMKLSTKIIVPFIVIFLCFAGILVWVSVRSGRVLYDEKLLKTKHVVEVSYSLLDEYAKRAEKGEMTTEEAKKRAAMRIQNLRYDEKEYFWINDLRPYMIMHPYKPELNGKDLSENKDPNGKRLFIEFVKVCKEKGEGAVEYMWPKHEGSEPVPKVSYVKLYKPWGWIVGSGIYIDDVQREKRKTTSIILILAGIVIIGGMIIAVLLTRAITKPINRVIEGLGQAADQVASASNEVSSASQSLAEGASEQAASIEETSSSLEEMSSMTKQNADNASQCDRIQKEEVSANFKLVEERLAQMQKAIAETVKAGEETGKIIKTIDEIAFQTNLLALNAAVEAARAGEAGAGFAVVADEVRNLAMRAAEAAKSTSNLIEGSNKQIKETSRLNNQVVEAMKSNAALGQKVSQLVSEVSAASNEQAQGIGQINKAVAEMDKVVQQVAATAEESASASEEMNAQAEEMKRFVGEMIVLVEGGARTREDQGVRKSAPNTKGKPRLPQMKRNAETAVVKHGQPGPLMKHAKEIKPNEVIPLDEDELEKF